MMMSNQFIRGIMLAVALWGSAQACEVDDTAPVSGQWEATGAPVSVSIEQVAAAQGQFYILDLRGEQALRLPHLRGAVPVVTSDLPRSQHLLPRDMDTPVLVYDQDGRQVREAAHVLGMMGYQRVYVLEGGIAGQQRELVSSLHMETMTN